MRKKMKALMLALLSVIVMLTAVPVTASAASRTKPGKVTMVSAKATAYNKIQVKWKKASNATHNRIYYKKAGTRKWNHLATVSGKTTSYTHKNSKKKPLVTGQKYTYTVRAYNSRSKRLGSYDTKGKTTYTKPNKVKLRGASYSSSKKTVTVSWNRTGTADRYVVYRKTPGTGWKRMAVIKNNRTAKWTDRNPVKGKKNTYTVRSYYSKTKRYGNYDSRGKSVTIPVSPSKVKLRSISSPSQNQVKLSWNKASNATTYRIYYKTPGGRWKMVADTSGTSYTHTSSSKAPLKAKTKYIYTVKAYNKTFKKWGSYDTRGLTVTTQAVKVPAKVQLRSISSPSHNQVKLTWNKASNATSYRVYYKTSGGSWKMVADTSGTSYTHTSSSKAPLKERTKYTYTVKAYNNSSKKWGSYDSRGLTVTTPQENKTPSQVKLGKISSPAYNKVTLSWNKASNATEYHVFYKTPGGSWQDITTTTSTSYTHVSSSEHPLKANTQYVYTVRAYNRTSRKWGSYDSRGLTVTTARKPDVKVEKITLNKDSILLTARNATENLYYEAFPWNATNSRATWSSSNPKVATVQNGKVTAVSEGTAVITVKSTDGTNKTASCTVTVKYPEPPKEPSAELKAALDEITSKDYEVMSHHSSMIIEDKRFQFVTDGSTNLTGENVCKVTSGDRRIAYVEAYQDSDGQYSEIGAYPGEDEFAGQSTTLTFTLGKYVRTCKITVLPDNGIDLTNVPDEELAADTFDNKAYAQEIFRLINDFRVENGRKALVWNENVLLREASIQAGYNICNGVRLEAKGDNHGAADRLARHGAGQIGVGVTAHASPKEVFNAWINSPLHKANILDKSSETIGVAFFDYTYDDGWHEMRATSVICSFGAEPEYLQGFSEELIKKSIMTNLRSTLKTEDDYYKFMDLFYHPSNTPVSVRDHNEDFGSEAVAADFGDGSSNEDVSVADIPDVVSETESYVEVETPVQEESLETETTTEEIPVEEPIIVDSGNENSGEELIFSDSVS